MRTVSALSIAALLIAGPGAAQAPPAGRASEITVTGRRPIVVTGETCPAPDPARHPSDRDPQVVDSYPRQDARVAPGFVQVRVTFDQPMSCYSEVMVDGGPSEPCRPDGSWALPERRSWTMPCRFPPGLPVRISFRRIDGRGFVGLSGRTAQPFVLAFTTAEGPGTASMEAAAVQDPGPPDGGERRGGAQVVCTDRGERGGTARDCRREQPSEDTAPPS